jgi:hypothetical protein
MRWPHWRRTLAWWLACAGGVLFVAAFLLLAGERVQESAARSQSRNNLRQIAITIQSFADVYGGRLPPVNGEAGNLGIEGHSWRVHVLPFVECNSLYSRVKEQRLRWDDPGILVDHRFFAPQFPARPSTPKLTYYRVFVGKGAMFDGPNARLSPNKILVVEAAKAVPWTKPEELEYDPYGPLPPLGGLFADGFHAVYGDGEVRFFPRDMDETLIRSAITGTYQGERPGR